MAENEWEQANPGDEGVDEAVERYLREDTPAGDSGPGSTAAPGQGATSGEGFDDAEQIVERVLEQLGSTLDQKLDSVRQELREHAERTAQSFSDKTASRLSQRQKEQMEQVDRILGFLKDDLGPDFEDVRRRVKMQTLVEGAAREDGREEERGEPAPRGQSPAAGQSADQFVQVYLSKTLGDPSQYSEEEMQALHRDLSQARDWSAWMATVDGYAKRGPSQSKGPQSGSSSSGNPARAHMVGAPTGKRPPPKLEELSRALDRATAAGDFEAMQKIAAQIDAAMEA